jgi:hypothetical protein
VRKPVLVVAHDGSESLLLAGDTVAFRKAYQPELERFMVRMQDRFEVRGFTYGAQVREGIDTAQRDALTHVDALLKAVQERFSQRELGAVVIDGDGVVNHGADPRLRAPLLGVPIFAVALGDTTVRPDIAIRALNHERTVYVGNMCPLLVRVSARHMQGTSTTVEVLLKGEVLLRKPLKVDADAFMAELPLLVPTTQAGLACYTVRIAPVAGEADVANNQRMACVRFADDRQNVVLVAAAPHPDVYALRAALAPLPGYAFLVVPPGAALDMDRTDLLVVHGLPSRTGVHRGTIDQAKAQGVPMLFILSATTLIDAFNALQTGVVVENPSARTTDALASAVRQFDLFATTPEELAVFERFPPLQVPFGSYAQTRAAVALFHQRIGSVPTEQPLVALQHGEVNTAVICGEGIWRWRLADYQMNGNAERFDALVRKLVQVLARRSTGERFRVESEPTYVHGEPIVLTGNLYTLSNEVVNTPDAALAVRNVASGERYSYAFGRKDRAYRADLGVLPSGRYAYAASTKLNGETFRATGEFAVEERMAERSSTAADHGLWADLAANSGGLVVGPGGLDALADTLHARSGLEARSYGHYTYAPLIDVRWLLVVLLLLLVAEWALRRYMGSY